MVGRQSWRWVALGGVAVVVVAVAIWKFAPHEEAPTQAQEIPRIVVLPFENLGSPDDEYFASGITEEITSRLAAVSGLQVISRTSARTYLGTNKTVREIGEELDVGYALEGTIRWDRGETGHGRVRITPQLIRVADDSHLWSERYDRMLDDIFAVQSDIAEQVIDQMRATLLEPERRAIEALPTNNMEAYNWYLVGSQRYWFSTEEKYVRLQVEAFERAVELDPEFAIAYASLSEAHTALYHQRYDFTSERLEDARKSAERALALQPDLPDGHRALGWYYYQGFRDYDRALQEFEIASQALPNDSDILYGFFAVSRRQGRWAEALEVLDRWRKIDPNNYSLWEENGWTHIWLRQYEKAEGLMRRAIAIRPDQPDAYGDGIRLYSLWDGTTDRARRLVESAPKMDSPDIEYEMLLLDLYDRKPDRALSRLEESTIAAYSTQQYYVPKGLLECVCFSEIGEDERAKSACTSTADLLQREIDLRPHDYRVHTALGHALALLGRNQDAVRAAEHGVELMPISRDVLVGADQTIELAKIYTRVGRHDDALELIEELLSMPSFLSVGLLRLDPVWDPLRDNPRFQALLEKYDVER